jgi:hypothetical protein
VVRFDDVWMPQSSRSSGSRPWKCLRVQSNFGLGAFRRRARSRSSCARHLNRLDVRPMRHSILGARFDANDEAAASANRTANVTFVPDPHAAIMLTSTTSLRLDSKPLRSRGRSPSSRVMGRRSARTVVYSRAALAKRIPSANPALRGDSKVRHRTLELPSARYSGPRHARSGPLGACGGAVAEGDRRAARHASPDVEPGAANARPLLPGGGERGALRDGKSTPPGHAPASGNDRYLRKRDMAHTAGVDVKGVAADRDGGCLRAEYRHRRNTLRLCVFASL